MIKLIKNYCYNCRNGNGFFLHERHFCTETLLLEGSFLHESKIDLQKKEIIKKNKK